MSEISEQQLNITKGATQKNVAPSTTKLNKVIVKRFIGDISYGVPEEHYSNSLHSIGSYGKNGMLAIPFKNNSVEYKKVMPIILNLSEKSEELDEKIKEYFTEIDIQIPSDGLVLNVPLVLDETNYNDFDSSTLKDYITYLHLKNYYDMAEDYNSALSKRKPYYLIDTTEEKKKQLQKTSIKIEAYGHIKSLFDTNIRDAQLADDNRNKVNHILESLGIFNIKSDEDKRATLVDYIETDNVIYQGENRKGIDVFIQLLADKRLKYKALINKGLKVGSIKLIGTLYKTGQDYELEIGGSYDEAIHKLESPTGKDILRTVERLTIEKSK